MEMINWQQWPKLIILVASLFRNVAILTNGKIVTVAGTGVVGYNGDYQLATNAQISTPLGICVSSDDELYIADCYNHRIRKVLNNGMIITIAGTGVKGYNGDDILAIHAQLFEPTSVFVSNSNEVFISEYQKDQIRKIDSDGIITTIAGIGQMGYNGDNILAVQSNLNCPWDVMVVNDEVYIADRINHRIRKVLKNGMITTIAGTGVKGYNGDNILASNAQLSCPASIFVSSTNELFIADRDNHRIRKIDSDGIIKTIAGNGEDGYAGDIEYNHTEHGFHDLSNLPKVKIMKFERDCLYSTSVIGFLPMIELLAPQFTKSVMNENFISHLDSKEQEAVQQLIDSILYDTENIIEPYTIEDILRFIFILNNVYGEFTNLKRYLVTSFVEKLKVSNVLDAVTMTNSYLEKSKNVEEHDILFKVKEFCFEYIAKSMQQPNCPLIGDEKLNKYAMFIFKPLGTVSKTLCIDEKPFNNDVKLEQLYNDKKTSDVKIKMKDSFLFCHKSVLSSTSQMFRSMFESNSSFVDLVKDTDGIDVFTPECDEEILIFIIKHCYGIEQEIDPNHIIPMVEMAHLHEIEALMNIRITFENFFEIAQCLKHEINSEIMSSVVSNLVNFAVSNNTELFQDMDDIRKLPKEILVRFVHNMTQNQMPSSGNSKKRKQY